MISKPSRPTIPRHFGIVAIAMAATGGDADSPAPAGPGVGRGQIRYLQASDAGLRQTIWATNLGMIESDNKIKITAAIVVAERFGG